MSLSYHPHLLTPSSPSRFRLYIAAVTTARTSDPSPPPITSRHLVNPPNSLSFRFKPHNVPKAFTFTLRRHNSRHFQVKAHQSDAAGPTSPSSFNLDAVLSIAEVFCIVSSAVASVFYAVSCTVLGAKMAALIGVAGGHKVVLLLAWGVAAMASGVAIGAWIRRRQWRSFCRQGNGGGGESVNLMERIEKLEDDLRSTVTIVRVLSRQLEKLGIRFRVTRKALKHPISETAALAQKNSEATRALAMQEDILEKELGEIQKVLLAMQEQQQKQLELILAIGKTGKLWESKRGATPEKSMIETSDLTGDVKQFETQETQPSGASKGSINDRP